MGPVDSRDDGFTLIEILITLVIIGIAVSAVLAGIGVASRGSGDTRAAADASAVLTAAAEQIEQETNYQECPADPAAAYTAALGRIERPRNGGATAPAPTVLDVLVWDGNSFEPPVAGASCLLDDLPGTDSRATGKMQRITLKHGDDTLTFVKRGP